jgi:hypothetical protein
MNTLNSYLSKKFSAPQKKFLGVKDIPVEQISGPSNKPKEAGRRPQPFNRSIVVDKVGDQYVVRDGHYQVSAARFLGRNVVQAEVWEAPVQVQQAKTSKSAQHTEGSSVTPCAAD